jgi:hypothetical protein
LAAPNGQRCPDENLAGTDQLVDDTAFMFRASG